MFKRPLAHLPHRGGLLLAAFLLATNPSKAAKLVAPFAEDAPLPVAEPSEMGLDGDRLTNMAQQIEAKKRHRLHSIVVVRRGHVVFEKYYNGYTRDHPHDLRSATKSLTSLLVGAALDQRIVDLDAPMMRYLAESYPEVRDKGAISLRHLLTMSSGLDCHDRDRKTRGQEDRMYRRRDWVKYFLSLDTVHPPGTVSRYCTGGIVALGEVVAQANQGSFAEFAERSLFEPLGIRNYRWATFDNDEKIDSGGHLMMTPQGMAKIGMLVLKQGRWQDRQLVSEEWVRQSTTEQTTCDDQPYGFLWWFTRLPYAGKTFEAITASGNGGQLIFVIPELDLVTVFTAGYYNSDKARIPYELFYHGIVPSIIEVQPYLQQATKPEPEQ